MIHHLVLTFSNPAQIETEICIDAEPLSKKSDIKIEIGFWKEGEKKSIKFTSNQVDVALRITKPFNLPQEKLKKNDPFRFVLRIYGEHIFEQCFFKGDKSKKGKTNSLASG
jgi:hypothetical protein